MIGKLNKKGAALLQVLILSTILAGMVTMILRVTLSRTTASQKVQHQVKVQEKMESCMAEVNIFWASKTPEAYKRDLTACQMCDPTADSSGDCSSGSVNVSGKSFAGNRVYHCTADGVVAVMENGDSNAPCKITYVVPYGTNL